jgi:hypothetical protein
MKTHGGVKVKLHGLLTLALDGSEVSPSLREEEILLHITVLCGLVVGVPGYRSGGLGFDPRALQREKKVVGLERGPLSLVSTTEELLGRNSSGSGLESRKYSLGIRHADHVAPSIRKKSWHQLR